MRKALYLVFAVLLLCSHDLYIKMDAYFLEVNQEAVLNLYNGTFEKSENLITRDRMLDASLVGGGKRLAIAEEQWSDQDSTISQVRFQVGEEGTYVAGVSTKARNIELAAQDFNDYLKHDGVLDMLAKRQQEGTLESDAVESYEKHVKAIYQVGEVKTDDWNTVLGYPIEFVPLENPYDQYSGGSLKVQLLLDGKPLPNQLVYADYVGGEHSHDHEETAHNHSHDKAEEHSHDHADGGHSHSHDKAEEHSHDHADGGHSHSHDKAEEHSHDHEDDDHSHSHDKTEEHAHDHGDGGHSHSHDKAEEHSHDHKEELHFHAEKEAEETHTHTSGQELLTNAQGEVEIKLPADGVYYLRTIHMREVEGSDELTHRSKWATLSFEVTHQHGEGTHTHEHEEGGIPTWVFALGSLLVVGILFLVFRKK